MRVVLKGPVQNTNIRIVKFGKCSQDSNYYRHRQYSGKSFVIMRQVSGWNIDLGMDIRLCKILHPYSTDNFWRKYFSVTFFCYYRIYMISY